MRAYDRNKILEKLCQMSCLQHSCCDLRQSLVSSENWVLDNYMLDLEVWVSGSDNDMFVVVLSLSHNHSVGYGDNYYNFFFF